MLWIRDPNGYISSLHLWIIRQHRFITRPLVFYGKRNNLWINVSEWVGTSLPCLENSSFGKLHMDQMDRKYQKPTYLEMTIGVFYRPQRSCEGYVFTVVCLSTGGLYGPGGFTWSEGGCMVPGGAPGRGGLVSRHALRQTPRERRLLLWTVRILLECILFCSFFGGF